MGKGIMARLFGGMSKNNTKKAPAKKSQVVAATPSFKTSSQSTFTNIPSTSRSPQAKKALPASTHTPVAKPPLKLQHVEKEDSLHLFSDTKDKLTDMNDFINIANNNDIDLHLKNLNNLSDCVSYQASSHSQDEYLTISSTASSSLSLQDALFSHLSTSDAQSEISQYSDFPKIAVRTHKRVDSLFDRPSYSFADTNSNNYVGTLPNTTTINDGSLCYEKYFCDLYIDALHFLSNKQDPSPAQAFRLFEIVARQGHQVYSTLSIRCQYLVSFAQYRAGRMLCESECVDDGGTEQGLVYLLESSKNGNVRATFILGCYAERRGDIDHACHLYHQAAVAGVLPAKVSFGNTILFKKKVAGFRLEEALLMLNEASQQSHSIASLSLALYYEKSSNLQLALKYCCMVDIPPSSPIFCVSTYQLGVIFLKSGPNYADLAFCKFRDAANASYYENGILTKFTVALRKLGVLSLMGIGTVKNPVAAFNYIQEAAQHGDEPANILLGQMHLMGLGCPVDHSRAMQIFESYPGNIAAMLSRGLLMMKKNPEYAYDQFVKVLQYECTPFDQEHWDCQSIKYEASVRVAVWEYSGICGTEENPARAFHTLKRLSEDCNYNGAHYWLACAYLEGVKLEDGTVVVSKDQELAFAYFLKGAQQNKAECQYQVGLMLREGYSNSQLTKADAFEYFLKAAKRNLPPALTQVGVYYFSGGLGTNGRDLNKAFHYFTAAAKHNDSLAIQYLADYMIKNNASGPINRHHIYTELNRAAGAAKDPIAYRMLALVVDNGIDPRETYENPQSNHEIYDDLMKIYKDAKVESMMTRTDIKFRFALHCLWKAIELKDYGSGQCLCNLYPKMQYDDIIKTIEAFKRVEEGVPNKLSNAYAQFLKVSKNRSSALTKYIEVAKYNDIRTSIGWNARLEAAKLILIDYEGKTRSRALIFSWLSEMITYNGKNLFVPFILLAKCHDEEICAGCDKSLATQYYENGLQNKRNDISLEIYARMRLVETYYKSHADTALKEQLDLAERLLESLTNASEKRSRSADLYYYRGLLALHNGTIFNYREIARVYLSNSEKLGNILACLELGYLYGTMERKEEAADTCFQKVENSSSTTISFKNRITESMVQVRRDTITRSNEYLVAINKMKLAAGITYSYYNMERQALDWFQEISDEPLAHIMILYHRMKDPQQRSPHVIKLLSDLMSPFEAEHSLDYYSRMALSYGQLRLGQCYEFGDGVPVDNNKVLDYYNKACAFLQNNETYERLAEISDKHGSDIDLFPTLYNAARNDTGAMFRLAQYYHAKEVNPVDPDVPSKKAADQYFKAAQVGHAQSCYYYAKYRIHQMQQSTHLNAAAKSKKAVNYLRIAANKNHGPSYYELGKLELAAGLYEEGVEDLKEAVFLDCGAASYELGELYREGFTGIISDKVTFRINPNLDKALKYYLRAVDLKYPMAMIKVGHFFETGALVKQSTSQAKSWYMKAFNSGQCREGAAEYALGCLEETCMSVSNTSNVDEHRKYAFNWFQQSLEANNKQANFKIGCYLLHGWIVQTTPSEDIIRGVKILEKEYGNGNVQAMKELARYSQDQGNYKTAIFYWRRAELLNDPEALEFLAQCFEKGLLGQDVNIETAIKYKTRALEARKQAVETHRSMMGFKSDYSEERNDY